MNPSLKTLLDRIQTERRVRVWSLIITFLGDAIVPRGGEVSASTIQELMTRLGVESGAVRTAMSRLTSDGWVIREKRGRRSFFRLSKTGYDPFRQATARIYAPADRDSGASPIMHLIVANAKSDRQQSSILRQNQVLEVHPGVYVSFDPRLNATKEVTDSCLVTPITASQLPNWVKEKLGSEAQADGYRTVSELFRLFPTTDLTHPIDAMALRCLLIHEWRRVLLRGPDIPNACLPNNWPLEACRKTVASLYQELLPASEIWLDEVNSTSTRSSDKINIDFQHRFVRVPLETA